MARIEVALLDPPARSELGFVATHILDEPLGVLPADERLDGIAERVVAARPLVEDHVHPHGGHRVRYDACDVENLSKCRKRLPDGLAFVTAGVKRGHEPVDIAWLELVYAVLAESSTEHRGFSAVRVRK